MIGNLVRSTLVMVMGSLYITASSSELSGIESSYGQKHQMDSVVRLDHIPPGQGRRIADRLILLPIGTFAWILVHVLVFSHEEESRYTL